MPPLPPAYRTISGSASLPKRTVLEQLQIEDFRKGEAIFKGRAKDRETAVAALSGLPGEPLVAVNRDDLLVLPPDVDKGAAIRHIAAVRGLVMTELIAVGDGEVDAPMLRAAGMSFAPHDATETATAAATVVLKRCGAQATCDLLDRLAAANH